MSAVSKNLVNDYSMLYLEWLEKIEKTPVFHNDSVNILEILHNYPL